VKDDTADFRKLHHNSLRVFKFIEDTLDSMHTDTGRITREDIGVHCFLSPTAVKEALRELKQQGIILTDFESTPKISINSEYKIYYRFYDLEK
jgi:prephenate dehydratase